jgi:amino acid permease
MNFKPNLLKSIISLVIGTVILMLIAGIIKCKAQRDCSLTSAYQIFISLIAILIVYIVWSLLQKRDNKIPLVNTTKEKDNKNKIQSVSIPKEENNEDKIKLTMNKSKKSEKKLNPKKKKGNKR